MDEKVIVENIRKLRQSKEISIEQLAKLSGLTKGYISKIEHSQKAPPIMTLGKIAMALNTDVTFFFSENPEPAEQANGMCIVRKTEGKAVVSRGTLYGYNYTALAYKKAGKNMEPYIIEPAFGDKKIFSHDGEEFHYTLEGTQEFYYGETRTSWSRGTASISIPSCPMEQEASEKKGPRSWWWSFRTSVLYKRGEAVYCLENMFARWKQGCAYPLGDADSG